MNILIVGSGCSAVYLASLISFYKKEIKVENARKTFTCKITKESIPEEDFYDLYYFISQFLIARAEIERTYLKVINTEQFVISTQFKNNYIYHYRGDINITNNYYGRKSNNMFDY